jgi:hypothetical protein
VPAAGRDLRRRKGMHDGKEKREKRQLEKEKQREQKKRRQ